MLDQLIKEIDLYYKSGNDVPVERATIPADKWQALKAEIEALEDEILEAMEAIERD